MLMKRELYLKKLEMYTGRDEVKLVTGMRRTGKSTLIRQLIAEMEEEGVPEENIVYINFEGLVFSYFRKTEDLRSLLFEFLSVSEDRMYFFLDELPPVENWAKVLMEMMNLHSCEFTLISSNGSLFYDGFKEDLQYKYVRINVYPLVFSEFLELKGETELTKEELFREYLRKGGMPAVYSMAEEAAENYLRDTYSSILLKDVVQCNNLRDVSHIDRIMEYLLSHIGETFSPKGIRDDIKRHGIIISVDTVYSFLDALIGAGLIYRVPRFDIKEDRELETHEKYYFADAAMRDAVCGDGEIGREAVLENVLYTELISRNFKVNTGRYASGCVDFIAFKGEDRTYLQSCDRLNGKEDIQREFRILTRIPDNYFKMVLSMDPETKVNKGGIINYPLISFLTQG